MNTANVSTGKPKTTGAIFRAPLGTPLPTDASTALAAAYKNLGFASDAGVANNNSPETEDIYAWGGSPVMNIITEKPDTWKVTLIESTNADVLKTVYGEANVTVDESAGTINVKATNGEITQAVYVFDMVLNGGALKRVVIPIGSLGELGEIVYKDDEPIGYEITIKAMDDGSGATHYEYIKKGAK